MIKKVEDIVIDVLQNVPRARDDDQALCALVWRKQIAHNINNITLLEFLQKLAEGKYHKASSLIRCRRKVQELHEDLRGFMYDKRKKAIEKVKDDLETMSAESTGPNYSSAPLGKKQGDLF